MGNQDDVIGISAGPGGCSAAALMAKAGKKIPRGDKNKVPGGAC